MISRICLFLAFTIFCTAGVRIKRDGGFPKFPVSARHRCVQCGTRVVDHQPERIEAERTSKIVGGSPTPYGAYPWQVEIQAMKQDGENLEEDENYLWEHHCGGAIIGESVVLTAAHCIQMFAKSKLRVILGKHSLSKPDKYEHVYKVTRIKVHPDFRKDGPHSNDIALLEIQAFNETSSLNKIKCGTHVKSICLPDHNVRSKDVGDWCTVSGWGTKVHGSRSISRVLQAASVPLLDLATCRQTEVYGSARLQTILDSMICAGTLEGGVDACGGDSGGPLACKINDTFVLIGVVSWGDGCAQPNRPGVYTRVSYFLPWIQESLSSMNTE